MSDSDNESDYMDRFFTPRDIVDEVLYFRNIYTNSSTDTGTEIVFQYNFCDEVQLESKLYLEGVISSISDVEPTIKSIGMCILLWYV